MRRYAQIDGPNGLFFYKNNENDIPFKFKEIVNGLNNDEHKTREGFERLVNLVFQTKGKGKRKYSKEQILSDPQRLHVENCEKQL